MTDREKIERIIDILTKFFKGDLEKVNLWLETKNPWFGLTTPNTLMQKGRIDKVLKFVEQAELDEA